ncbi:MAG: gfo/Idh/MocA family oxidoreductase, partial [Candidatus Zixiibacteriota bacterium]
MKNFAITGVGGYVAPRHLAAIRDTGNLLVAAVDPSDSVGIIDRFFPDARFFTEFERFDRHCEKLRRTDDSKRIHCVSICSPNYLHDAHVRFALRIGADAICEKPLVLNPWNIDALAELERESGRKVNTILQLRVHPSIIALREKLMQDKSGRKHDVVLTYVTSRGPWYLVSWKGQLDRSGGLATNIGIHFFDLVIWLFGKVKTNEVHVSTTMHVGGYLELERADVRWFLSIDRADLPPASREAGKPTYRSITIDGEEVEFSEGFTDLHTEVYRRTLAGQGFGLEDARPSIQVVHDIREAPPK